MHPAWDRRKQPDAQLTGPASGYVRWTNLPPVGRAAGHNLAPLSALAAGACAPPQYCGKGAQHPCSEFLEEPTPEPCYPVRRATPQLTSENLETRPCGASRRSE